MMPEHDSGIMMFSSEQAELIGSRVRDRRKELKLTQEKVAEAMGYDTYLPIWKIETGKGQFPIAHLYVLCQILHCSSDYLLYGDRADLKMNDIIHDLEGLDPHTIECIHHIIEAALEI